MTNTIDSKSMSKSHVIQVPQELAQELWLKLRDETASGFSGAWHNAVTRAAQWGWDQREPEIQQAADQMLDACCDWASKYLPYLGDFPMPEDKLRAAMRPSLSPVERVRSRLACLMDRIATEGAIATAEPIRECLEILDKLEAQQ
jgi:hypothetical protein